MTAIQLELNMNDANQDEIKIDFMQKQITAMEESMGKVRRKLFSQMGEMQKLCLELKIENETLRNMMKEIKNEKIKWIYGERDYLFDVREA